MGGWVGQKQAAAMWETGYGHELVGRVEISTGLCTVLVRAFCALCGIDACACVCVCVCVLCSACVCVRGKRLGGVTGGRRLKADNLRKF